MREFNFYLPWLLVLFLFSDINCIRIDRIEPTVTNIQHNNITVFGDFTDGNGIIFSNEKALSFHCIERTRNDTVVECNVNFIGVYNGILRAQGLTGTYSSSASSILVEIESFDDVFRSDDTSRGKAVSSTDGEEKSCSKNTVVTSLSPDRGSPRGGQLITITGCYLPFKSNVNGLFGSKPLLMTFSRADHQVECELVEFLSSATSLVCRTDQFPSIGRWKFQISIDGSTIKMISNNKFFVFDQFAPQIHSIETGSADESYFFGVGDTVRISGQVKADSYEPVEDNENILSPFVELTSQTYGKTGTCDITAVDTSEMATISCRLNSVALDFYQLSLKTTLEGKSVMQRGRFPLDTRSYDIMTYPVIRKAYKDHAGLLHISGDGLDDSCKVSIGDWSCLKRQNSIPNLITCEPVESRANMKIIRFPSDLGMKFEQYDLSSIDAKLEWSLIKVFAHNFDLVSSQAIFESSMEWDGRKTFAKITGYFRPVSTRGSFRVRTNGMVLFRMRKCERKGGVCVYAEKLLMQTAVSREDIYTRTTSFDFAYLYYLEIYILAESSSGKNFLEVMLIDNDPDPATIRKDNSIFEKVIFDFTREEIATDIHEIKLTHTLPETFQFKLRVDNHVTEPISLQEDRKSIVQKLEALSTTSCEDLGLMNKVMHEDFENSRRESTRMTEPFCGDYVGRSKTEFIFKVKSIRLDSQLTFCFAFRGRINNLMVVEFSISTRNSKRVARRHFKMENIESNKKYDKWRFVCNNMEELIGDADLIGSMADEIIEIESITLTPSGGDLVLDEVMLGHSQGYYERVQKQIGARPGGHYIVDYGADWKNSKLGFDGRLHIAMRAEGCVSGLPLIKIDGEYDVTEIKNPHIVRYTDSDTSIQVEKYSEPLENNNEMVRISYRDQSTNIDLSLDDIDLAKSFYKDLDISATLTSFGSCFERTRGFVLEVDYIEDLRKFTIDITNSSFETAKSDSLANGGILIGPLTARNMQLVTNKKSIYLTCRHDIISQCRTNCIYDQIPTFREVSVHAPMIKVDEQNRDFEGSGERIFDSRLHHISFDDEYNFDQDMNDDNGQKIENDDNIDNDNNDIEIVSVDFTQSLQRKKDCEILSVLPRSFSLLGGVMVTILTAGSCDSSDLKLVEIGGSPCEVIFQANNKITCDLPSQQIGYQINFKDLVTGWEPNVVKIPTGSVVNWKWDLFEMTNDELSEIRVQETMSKNRIEFNQIGFQSEINQYNFKRQFLNKGNKIIKHSDRVGSFAYRMNELLWLSTILYE